jgi:PASTA domain
VVLVLIAGLGCLTPAVFANGTVNIVGTWQVSGAGCPAGTTPAGVQTWVVKSENLQAGTFTGTGSGAGYTWTLANGKISGSSFTMSTTYAGYTATERGSVSADGKHMTGTFAYGRTNGCFSGVLTSSPKRKPVKTPKHKPAKSPKKKGKKGAVVSCVVPGLGGKTLSAAKATLKKAHCALGRVSEPKRKQHHTLHVRSQSPKPGRRLKANSKVAVTLR